VHSQVNLQGIGGGPGDIFSEVGGTRKASLGNQGYSDEQEAAANRACENPGAVSMEVAQNLGLRIWEANAAESRVTASQAWPVSFRDIWRVRASIV